MTEYSREWETVTDDECAGCARLRVHGGWLVVAWVNTRLKKSERLPESLVFVPDETYNWGLKGNS